jgi:hypothetical protein
MDENVALTHKSLTILTALLDQLRRNGALTDEEVKEIVANPPNLVGTINPTSNNNAIR